MFILFLISIAFADQCKTGEHWDQNYEGGKCRPCKANCKSCWSQEKCTSCNVDDPDEMKRYYLNSNYECVQRDPNPNCKTWDGLYCIECSDGYYIQDMKCNNPCGITNCAKCNSNKCFKCVAGYTLYEAEGKQECIDCKLAANDEKCGRCPLGKYFNTTSFKCENCRENCGRCTTGDNCYLCSGDYALETPSDPKSKCVKIANCQSGHYYGNHCELCEEGFYVSEGKCKACSENCARCIDENTCVECKQGSTLSGNKCEKDEYCIRSSDLMGCIECKEGWYLGDNGKCQQCAKQCKSCLNSTYCFRCAENYFFNDVKKGDCKEMDKQTCSVSDQYGCLQCKYDVVVSSFNSSESHITQDTIDKKSEGITWKNVTDDKRYFGFYLELNYNNDTKTKTYNKECSLCDPRCRICEYKSTWCTGCNDGYQMQLDENATAEYFAIFGVNTQIHKCVPKNETCEKTEMGYCIECVSTHFLSGIDCIQCNPSCGTCVSTNWCQSCKDENVTINGTEHKQYWRPPKFQKEEGDKRGICWNVTQNMTEDGVLLHCLGGVTQQGCSRCQPGYYKDDEEGDCYECGSPDPSKSDKCRECDKKKKNEMNSTKFKCTQCNTPDYFLRDGLCLDCKKTIEHCKKCNTDGCDECEDGYSVNTNRSECTRVNLELILPLVGVGLIFIIIIIVVIVILIWRKRRKTMKEREKEIKPFKVSNEVEMALLSADNENFPLKTSTWTLDFGHAGSKVNIDMEYEQTIQIMNPTRKSYFFEILAGASHRYELQAEPMRFTLKPDYAIEVKFTIKMLCTAIVKDEIGIVAMDMDEEVKETAKLTILIESDLSTKLDHTELRLQMPAIGEGAFGMVFVGTYRGQKVAVKKMKARNLTEEQEKEFKHEVNMLTQYRHACVVNLVGAVYTEGEISIVTEFADYGSLSKVWAKEKISFDLKIKFMEDAVVALSYLHENNILHRDVKGENVLVYSLNPHSPVCGKLTDFGTCRNISERSLQSKELSQGIGTPTYMAPECLGNNSYSYQADVYSFAIVLYETFTEVQAYIEDERFNQPWMIPQFVIEGKRLERPEGMPDSYWALIEQCWQQEPEDRPLFPQIYATLASWGLDICNTEMSVKAAPIDLPAAGAQEEYVEEEGNETSSSSEE